jgi:hypothetical protein
MLMKDGVRRPLARAALSDRLPPVLLNEKRKVIRRPVGTIRFKTTAPR